VIGVLRLEEHEHVQSIPYFLIGGCTSLNYLVGNNSFHRQYATSHQQWFGCCIWLPMNSYIFKHISFLFEIFIMESWTFACLKIIPFKVFLQSFLFPLGILRRIQLANLYSNVRLLSVKQLFRHKLWIKICFLHFCMC
jgi:hypothetical protein